MEELIYSEDSYYILGVCYSIQNKLGSNLKEKPYGDAMEAMFRTDKKEYVREYEILVPFGDIKISGGKVDFLYEQKILIDIKSKKYITKEDYRQMIRYLEASGCVLGLVVNFRGSKVTCKRVVNSKNSQL